MSYVQRYPRRTGNHGRARSVFNKNRSGEYKMVHAGWTELATGPEAQAAVFAAAQKIAEADRGLTATLQPPRRRAYATVHWKTWWGNTPEGHRTLWKALWSQ